MEKISDKDKETLRTASIPGIYTTVKIEDPVATEFDISELHTIREQLGIDKCDPMDFNSYMHIAQVVAKQFGLGCVALDIDRYYAKFAGQPITIQSIIIFWMFVLQRYKE